MEQTREIDQAALFLADQWFPNMFEETRDASNRHAGFRCKVCGEVLRADEREPHHAEHKQDKSHYATEQIRARREQDMAKDASKRNVSALIEQYSIPKVYLREDGKAFRPGGDAQLKRDLIAAIDSLPNPNGLHKFDASEAAKILSGFGYNEHLVKSRKNREAQEARAKAKAAEKANAEKAKATAKREQAAKPAAKPATEQEVKPDPKPSRRGAKAAA